MYVDAQAVITELFGIICLQTNVIKLLRRGGVSQSPFQININQLQKMFSIEIGIWRFYIS